MKTVVGCFGGRAAVDGKRRRSMGVACGAGVGLGFGLALALALALALFLSGVVVPSAPTGDVGRCAVLVLSWGLE